MIPLSDIPLARRDFLCGTGPMAALLLAPAASLAALPNPGASRGRWQPNFDDPKDNVEAYMKLTSTLGDDTVMSWFGGHVFSLVDGQTLKPLMALEGFGVGSAKRQPDGTFRILWKEVGFYKDLVTGAVLDTWMNPVNGERTQVMHIHNRGVNSTIAPSFKRVQGGPPGMSEARVENANYRHPDDPNSPFILPWFQVADTVSVWMDVSAVLPNPLPPKEWPRESSGATIRIAEQTLHTAKLADFSDPALSSVDYVGAWNRFSPWLPWMLMGGRPGGLFFRSATRRIRSYEQLPRALLDYTAKHYAEFLDPHVDPNRKNESSWEVFKKERRPAPVKSG